MDTMEWIRSRRSVRTFDGGGMKADAARAIIEYADGVENPWGLPIEWRILDARRQNLSCPVIAGTDAYIAGKLRRAPHAEEAFGYAFEKVVLHAWRMGIGTTWIAGTMDRPAFERAVDLQPGEVMPCVSPLGVPAGKMSLKESLMRKGVKADSRLAFSRLFFEGDFSRPLAEEAAGEIAGALECVRWAPSAVNRQPWRAVVRGECVHFYEKKARGYVDRTGWDLQKVDMGIALCHFALGCQGRTLHLVMEDPGLEAAEDTEYIASWVVDR